MPKPRSKRKPGAKKTLRIFCEGEKTEPYYIQGYLRRFKDVRNASVVVMDCKQNTPVQLVDAATKFKGSNRSIEGDVFWVVYDRESVAKYPRELHVKAWSKAQANDINVALSNVCFEYWILLHLVDSSASYSSYDDLRKNSDLSIAVEKLCGLKYDKASAVLFDSILGSIPDARTRAVRINEHGAQQASAKDLPFDINPYTDIPKLLDAIDKFSP